MTPLEATPPPLVSPRTRQVVYGAYSLGSVVLGAIQVGYSAGQYEQPVWLIISTAVWVFLGGSQGLLALLNTTPPPVGEGVNADV